MTSCNGRRVVINRILSFNNVSSSSSPPFRCLKKDVMFPRMQSRQHRQRIGELSRWYFSLEGVRLPRYQLSDGCLVKCVVSFFFLSFYRGIKAASDFFFLLHMNCNRRATDLFCYTPLMLDVIHSSIRTTIIGDYHNSHSGPSVLPSSPLEISSLIIRSPVLDWHDGYDQWIDTIRKFR